MSDFEKIFNKESFVIPNYDKPDIVDLVRLIYNYSGMNFKETKSMQEIKKYVSNKKHIVLILVDGMGVDLLNKIPNKELFYKNKVMDIQTVFPTATGCVLTSVATAKYPSSTGIFGWFGYNRRLNLNYYTLLTKERKRELPFIISFLTIESDTFLIRESDTVMMLLPLLLTVELKAS